jgi:hypothetical protein
MVSGFTQLRCDLSMYHWQKIVHTAWFACVTHFCCLTFLRDHLLHNRSTQLWRVPSMVVLTTMIIYALTTLSQYDQKESGLIFIADEDYAICHLKPFFNTKDWNGIKGIISIIFLGFGMINRIRRLYHAPNILFAKLRNWTSRKARDFLTLFYRRGCADSIFDCLTALLLYRPLLTLFLMVRLIVDGLTSMAFEVSGHS